MTKQIEHEYEVRFRDWDLGGFLDMLRYDGGVVLSWNHDGEAGPDGRRHVYLVKLRGTRFTEDRWRSFGIGAKDLNR